MDRRRFISGIALGFVGVPRAAHAQQPAKVARIGYLVFASLDSPATRRSLDVFRQGLREKGYVEGKNVVIELRAAGSRIERLTELASELVRLKVDVIVVGGTPSARAAQQATATLPIVAYAMADPVNDGLVASLARPGGNITGLTNLAAELMPKRLALLKEALPAVSRMAALWQPGAFGERTMNAMSKETDAAARARGVQLQLVRVQGPDEFDRAFSMIARDRADALIVYPSTMFLVERRRLVDLAARYRLPAMYGARENVEIGGLMSYGANIDALNQRAAAYVDKILRGTKPGELAVEQPTKFELTINLKTAKALGITIAQAVLLRADEVIQ